MKPFKLEGREETWRIKTGHAELGSGRKIRMYYPQLLFTGKRWLSRISSVFDKKEWRYIKYFDVNAGEGKLNIDRILFASYDGEKEGMPTVKKAQALIEKYYTFFDILDENYRNKQEEKIHQDLSSIPIEDVEENYK